MNDGLKNISYGIIGTAIFCYFIQPMINFLIKPFFWITLKIGHRYLDSFFLNVARNTTASFDLDLVFILFGILVGANFILMVRALKRDKKPGAPRNFFSRLGPKTKKIFLVVLICFNILLSTASFLPAAINITLNRAFKQVVMVLAPYLKEQQISELSSGWASMSSFNDFKALDQKINKYFIDLRIAPPKGFSYGPNYKSNFF